MTGALRWLAVLALVSCSGGDDDSPGGVAVDTVPAAPPYESAALESVGRIEGVVAWSGPRPSDTTITLDAPVARICRTRSLRLTPVRVVRGGVSETMVWLDGIRRGKPLPASRRFELTTDRCRLSPVVQPAIAGGILNVLSLDRLQHRLQFTRSGTEGTLDRVDQFDEGQVVPLESVLRTPGPLSVQSDRFPWMSASIHVFDHPYFALTGSGGAFLLDSVPPGEHTLVVWHPVAGRRDTTVTIIGGDTVRVRLELGSDEA